MMSAINRVAAAVLCGALAVSVLLSCKGEEGMLIAEPSQDAGGELITVTFTADAPSGGAPATKAAGGWDEDSVNSLFIAVRPSNGTTTDEYTALAVGYNDSGNSVSLTLPKRLYADVVAITNMNLSKWDTPAKYADGGTGWEYGYIRLEDSSESGIVMIGRQFMNFVDGTNVVIPVDRTCAKVRFEGTLKNNIKGSNSVKLTRMWLKNVRYGSFYMDGWSESSYSGYWFNKLTYTTNATYDKYAVQVGDGVAGSDIAYGSSAPVKGNFYMWPNPTTTDSFASTWSARKTRLVLEVEMTVDSDVRTYYYPITLPPTARNDELVISEVELTKPGQTAAEEAIDKEWTENASMTFSITPQAWTPVTLGQQEWN